jgi:hypothetical protein
MPHWNVNCFGGLLFKGQVVIYLTKALSKFTKKIQQNATVHKNIILYLYEAQHVSGDTPPIIRSLKLH